MPPVNQVLCPVTRLPQTFCVLTSFKPVLAAQQARPAHALLLTPSQTSSETPGAGTTLSTPGDAS